VDFLPVCIALASAEWTHPSVVVIQFAISMSYFCDIDIAYMQNCKLGCARQLMYAFTSSILLDSKR